MKWIKNLAFVYVYLLGGFIILMALDCFDLEGSTWIKLGCFFISILPGLLIIILNYFLRKHRQILGAILLGYNVFFTLFFRFLENIQDNWVMLLLMTLPLLVISIYHYFDKK